MYSLALKFLYEECLATRGINAQKIAIPASNAISIGWRTLTPDFAAMAPVKNGKAADPACPIVAANPRSSTINTCKKLEEGRKS